jgi:hypothetical protein
MKKYVLMALSALLLLQACKKDGNETPEKPLPVIPPVPVQESQKAVTGVTVNNNGIVYTQINQELSYNKFITIDANADGKNDFYFTSVLIYHDEQAHMYLLASPVSKNGGKLQLDEREELVMNGMWAKPMDAGTVINASPAAHTIWSNFMIKGVTLDVIDKGTPDKTFNGPWVGKQDKYLALQIRSDDQVHYGWVRVSHNAGEQRLVLTGYAYNASPAEAINAGQTLK